MNWPRFGSTAVLCRVSLLGLDTEENLLEENLKLLKKHDVNGHYDTSDTNPKLDTRISFFFVRLSRSGDPPWILKRDGLKSSGRIVSSYIGKIRG